ncbi:hypothetical protein [Agrococcus sp. DT81.2]|uniref:hypothetical protein n=1 Tax=Agrococcus sp. DT81.2 TaxID=3393414 RepID=UPI003CE5B18A
MTGDDELDALVARVPLGWTRVLIGERAWGITRVDRAGGRSSTIDGEELGGARRMSANVWRTESGTLLRPCEMPAEQVLEVLRALPDGSPEALSPRDR